MSASREDVAKLAGVSQATVSNVINNKDVVSEKLKMNVLQAIHELDYHPNLVARSLKTNKTMQIALFSNDISNQYYAEIVIGMEEIARNSGYTVSMINSDCSKKNHIKEILERQYDGIIWSTDKIVVNTLNYLAERKIPLIFIGNQKYEGLNESITEVYLEIYNGAFTLFKYLIENGHKRIGYISPYKLSSLDEPDYRLKAYMDILNKYDIKFDPSIVFWNKYDIDYVYNSTLKMIEKENFPTAIFSGNDYFALPVISAINKTGLKIPDDISVAGFDNLAVSKYISPSLTTVDMPKYKLGKKAMELLIKKIDGEKIDNILLPTELIIRDSTAKIV